MYAMYCWEDLGSLIENPFMMVEETPIPWRRME